jgi:ABC-2 type transport system permease protein
VNWLRVFVVGGTTSYRALFHWLNPWVYVPLMLAYPLFQTVFFAYLGRGSGLESDRFFVIGNALEVTSVAGIFGIGQAMGNERWYQTLPVLLCSPASRLALFLGRALPTIANAIFVSAFALATGALVLGVEIPARAITGLALAICACAFSCTALGISFGALGLRGRNVIVFGNLIGGILLVICGVNVPLHVLPGWVQAIASGLPLTHGIEAGRSAVGGSSVADIGGLLGKEVLIGAIYTAVGVVLLKLFEFEGRRTASLETF